MPMDAFELAAVVFGALAVWLTTRENIWSWPTGLVNVGLYIVVFAKVKLYADMGLQVVYVIACLYGWYAWLHGGRDRGELHVTRTPRLVLVALLAVGALFAAALGWWLTRHTDAALPYLDSHLTSFSLVAQWMQTRKWLETWVLWIVVDVVYVGMYVFKHLFLTAGLYAVFLGLAVLGWRAWAGSRRRTRAA
jgi:nicotinamide mononucleotide transporter